tara:strand:- start:49 stop:471 length:423 start_codon:yes stop_codon:yes gene_type:complete
MSVEFERENNFEATSQRALADLEHFDSVIDRLIGELVRPETELHEFVGKFEKDEAKEEADSNWFGKNFVNMMNITCNKILIKAHDKTQGNEEQTEKDRKDIIKNLIQKIENESEDKNSNATQEKTKTVGPANNASPLGFQ